MWWDKLFESTCKQQTISLYGILERLFVLSVGASIKHWKLWRITKSVWCNVEGTC